MLVPMDERPVRDAFGNATPKKKDRRATPPAQRAASRRRRRRTPQLRPRNAKRKGNSEAAKPRGVNPRSGKPPPLAHLVTLISCVCILKTLL